MALIVLGLNHQTAPLALRERFVVSPAKLGDTLKSLGAPRLPQITQAVLLSTCNRTELYCCCDGQAEAVQPDLQQWFAALGQVSPQNLSGRAYHFEDAAAARQAFRVASGLDSMVLGEPQILGQLKEAVQQAAQAGTLGSELGELFQHAFAAAKGVRSDTAIGAQSVSLAAASVRLGKSLFEDLSALSLLFTGAGEMIELCATHWAAQRPQRLVFANRTLERAQALAARHGGEHWPLEVAPAHLAEFDLILTCTASTEPIFTRAHLAQARAQRHRRPMLVVDLAVPRDVEAEAAQLEDVFLYSLDDLAQLTANAKGQRQAAVAQAEALIEARLQHFIRRSAQHDLTPLVQRLHQRSQLWQQEETTRALRALQRGTAPEQALRTLARRLAAKHLHGALAQLHHADASDQAQWSANIEQFFLQPQRGK